MGRHFTGGARLSGLGYCSRRALTLASVRRTGRTAARGTLAAPQAKATHRRWMTIIHCFATAHGCGSRRGETGGGRAVALPLSRADKAATGRRGLVRQLGGGRGTPLVGLTGGRRAACGGGQHHVEDGEPDSGSEAITAPPPFPLPRRARLAVGCEGGAWPNGGWGVGSYPLQPLCECPHHLPHHQRP